MEMKSRRPGASAAVMRAMALFGGVQGASILCSVVRTKLVALWVGTAGVGLFGLYNSALDTLLALCTLGIGASSVRAMAAERSDTGRALTAAAVSRWGWILGGVGALSMIVLSPLLSRISFGDTSRAPAFALLGGAVLLQAVTQTRQAILQAHRHFKILAQASLWGAAGGLAVSAPLYYFLGLRSIVPSILAFCAVGFTAVCVLSPRRQKVAITRREMWGRMRGILSLGAYMTFTGMAAYLVQYIFLSWLTRREGAGAETAGLYQAGLTLFNRYAGLVLTAVAVEYYPRLSAMIRSRRATELCVAHEMTLLMLMLATIVPVFIVALPAVIPLLYSRSFMPMLPMVAIGAVGTVARGVSWCMSYTMLARADGRCFLVVETASSALCLALNIGGYLLLGLGGLGASYTLWYLLYSLATGWVYRRRYGLRLPKRQIALAAGVMAVSSATASIAVAAPALWGAAAAIAAASAAVAVRELWRLYRRR